MEQTLSALAGILLKAIPTIILVLLLHWYLKAMLFGPLSKVLKRREDVTAGARRSAEETTKLAEQKAADFEKALTEARAELYREQEVQRKGWIEDQTTQIAAAKQRANHAVAAAKANLDQESAEARQNLSAITGALADEIAGAVLGRGAHV